MTDNPATTAQLVKWLDEAGVPRAMHGIFGCIAQAESGQRPFEVAKDPTPGDPEAKAGGLMQLNNGTDALGVDPGFGMEPVDTTKWLDPVYNLNYAWRLILGRYRWHFKATKSSSMSLDWALDAWSTWWRGPDACYRVCKMHDEDGWFAAFMSVKQAAITNGEDND